MFVFFNWYQRIMVVATLATAQLAMGQVPSSTKPQARKSLHSELTPQTSPERVKELLLATMFTTCSRAGSALPTMFLNHISLHEYDDTWSKLLPLPIGNAERLDQIQYRGLLVVGSSAWRYFSGGKWTERVNSGARIRGATAKEILENEYISDWGDVVILIEKKNSKWFFELRGSLTNLYPSDPDDFPAKVSCGAAMSDNPQK